jgi:hypothetical protein
MPKAWHVHGNTRIEAGHFYPNLVEVGDTPEMLAIKGTSVIPL